MEAIHTERLLIRPMVGDDAAFMLCLLNDPSWLRFIGDRGVRTLADAQAYISNGPQRMYISHGFGFCLVESLDGQQPLGICGLAQRDYLDAPDIGFAFLPQHGGQGYAYEAAAAVLAYARQQLRLPRILATTRLDNTASQRLLAKLGMHHARTIRHPDGDRDLLLYEI
ncbi:GNAT family N-acetyltransferase [Chitinimonas sp.]|uniref:GNAT family N-acetyltransferase n=1 Tax=Chitinimonas sp. TaxID=1934313 RepID=UPI0035B18EC7